MRPSKRKNLPYPWALAALTLTASSCGGAEPGAPPGQAAPPIVYTAKVKNLLTGLPVTGDEAEAVTADPAALRALVDQWMATPQFRRKLVDFFKQAFQQTQLTFVQFEEQLGGQLPNVNDEIKSYLVRSAEMSFPLTALALVDEGRPFTEVLTTDRVMLNPPLMALLAYIDNIVVPDEGEPTNLLDEKFGDKFKFILQLDNTTRVPFEESIDPNGPNFLHFYEPCAPENEFACGVTTVEGAGRMNQSILTYLFKHKKFTDADWNDWRMVRLRPPADGEEPSIFWQLPSFRSKGPDGQEMRLLVPRVGFFTTPAFFANWPTNLSNLARATINQTLIVGLGYSLADTNAIVPVSETGNVDAEHSQPGTPCFGCHQTLDPMRNFFRRDFSVTYHLQTMELKAEQQAAGFTLDGATAGGWGVRDLAAIMAQQPRFAGAWAQKLCQYANSSPCVDDDPEFVRVKDAFFNSNYDFRVLIRELFSSPLVTLAAKTKTGGEAGGAVAVARREHFCSALENRLGLADVCNLALAQPTKLQNLAFGVPGAGYTRGAVSPILPREPNLFFSSSIEGLCEEAASMSVDPPACAAGQRCFYSAQAGQAFADLAGVVMGLPAADPRFEDVYQILAEHYGEAVAAGQGAGDALKSTFVLACSSPLSSAIGLLPLFGARR